MKVATCGFVVIKVAPFQFLGFAIFTDLYFAVSSPQSFVCEGRRGSVNRLVTLFGKTPFTGISRLTAFLSRQSWPGLKRLPKSLET